MAAIKLRENLPRQGTDAQITYERKHIMRILFDPDDDGWYSWSTASATANDLIQQRTAIRPPIRSDSQFISDLWLVIRTTQMMTCGVGDNYLWLWLMLTGRSTTLLVSDLSSSSYKSRNEHAHACLRDLFASRNRRRRRWRRLSIWQCKVPFG